MKNILTYSLLLILTFSCNSNDFSGTKRYFVTDKEIYRVNDNFEITVVVSPENGVKKIRFLKNLNNLNISFSLKEEEEEEELGFSLELKKHFIEGPNITRDDSDYIDQYTISKSQAFEKSFKGTISKTKQSIIFEIPELNITDSIEESKLIKNPTISIKGYCSSVYSGIEENFISKDIKILIE